MYGYSQPHNRELSAEFSHSNANPEKYRKKKQTSNPPQNPFQPEAARLCLSQKRPYTWSVM